MWWSKNRNQLKSTDQDSGQEFYWRALLENSLDLVVVLDAAGKIIYLTPQVKRLFGYEVAETTDKNISEFIHPEDRGRVAKTIADGLLVKDKPQIVEFRLRHKDGSWRVVEAIGANFLDNVAVGGLIVSIRDVTDRSRAEEAAQRRDAILEALGFAAERFLTTASWRKSVENLLEQLGTATGVSHAYVFEGERVGKEMLFTINYEWVSRGIGSRLNDPRLTRLSLSQMGLGRLDKELMSGRVVQLSVGSATEEERKVLEGFEVKSLLIIPVVAEHEPWGFIGLDDHKNEREWSMLEVGSLKAAADLLGASVARLRLEKTIEEERDRADAIISSMSEGLVVVGSDERVIILNPAAERMLQISAAEATGRRWSEVITILEGVEEKPQPAWPVMRTLKDGVRVQVELRDNLYYRTRAGRTFPVVMATAPLQFGGMNTAVLVFRDMTEEKKIDESRSNFIAIASHQLRSPLTTIRWYAEMLSTGDIGKLDKLQKEFAERILQGATRMNEVIKLLLALTKIESGRTEMELTEIDPRAFLADILKEMEHDFVDKRIRVASVIDPKAAQIVGDASLLRQVVINILGNAARYTPAEGSVEIRVGSDPGEVVFSVRDTGIGIPDADKPKIFQKFFRASNAMRLLPDGSGLGLAFAKSLVEAWGGRIWFESKEKQGTIFYFSIPLLQLKKDGR
ncbi:MAG: PAS domain S-box protein [Patescibacteria group bacterium]